MSYHNLKNPFSDEDYLGDLLKRKKEINFASHQKWKEFRYKQLEKQPFWYRWLQVHSRSFASLIIVLFLGFGTATVFAVENFAPEEYKPSAIVQRITETNQIEPQDEPLQNRIFNPGDGYEGVYLDSCYAAIGYPVQIGNKSYESYVRNNSSVKYYFIDDSKDKTSVNSNSEQDYFEGISVFNRFSDIPEGVVFDCFNTKANIKENDDILMEELSLQFQNNINFIPLANNEILNYGLRFDSNDKKVTNYSGWEIMIGKDTVGKDVVTVLVFYVEYDNVILRIASTEKSLISEFSLKLLNERPTNVKEVNQEEPVFFKTLTHNITKNNDTEIREEVQFTKLNETEKEEEIGQLINQKSLIVGEVVHFEGFSAWLMRYNQIQESGLSLYMYDGVGLSVYETPSVKELITEARIYPVLNENKLQILYCLEDLESRGTGNFDEAINSETKQDSELSCDEPLQMTFDLGTGEFRL